MDSHQHTNGNNTVDRKLWASVELSREMNGSSIVLLFGRMKSYLQEKWGVNHVTLEPEVCGCGETDVLGRWP